MCSCYLKSLKLVSWSDSNTGRRYYRCRHVWTARDCRFFRWIDPEYSDFLKTLLLDLHNVVRHLKREVAIEREAT
uniref:GRF-type domain-containing protein n=1 Tax=Oryza brachyantha TaxID=4533 RepID=J3MKS6_ORYBR